MRISGAKEITLEGLTLSCSRGTGIEVRGGERIAILGCTLRGLGTSGIDIEGGKSCRVSSCDVSDMGESGVLISGGDRTTLAPGGNVVENCDIFRMARLCRTYRPAIGIQGVGNRAVRNRLHDGPHNAILMGGNDHDVSYNEIYRVCTQTGDAGAIYMGRNLTMRGTVIARNYFHDIGPTLSAKGEFVGVMAVYLDDCFCGTTIKENLFVKAGRAAMIGGGRDNTIEGNLFVDCDPAVHVDSRGKSWAAKYFVAGGEWRILETLAEVHPKDPPYATRYPELATITSDDVAFARGNRILRNVIVGTGNPIEWQDGLGEKTVEMTGNVIAKKPVDVGFDSAKLTVRTDKIKGFAPVTPSRAGLFQDRYRRVVPVR